MQQLDILLAVALSVWWGWIFGGVVLAVYIRFVIRNKRLFTWIEKRL